MGFLGKIFGEKPKELAVSLENSEEFLEKELSGKMKQLVDGSAKKLAEIKHLLNQTKASLKQLDDASPTAKTARIDKIVSTAKTNALLQLGKLLEKLSPPNTANLAEIRKYCNESIITLRQSGHFGKNVAYAGFSFKNEMKAVGERVKELNDSFASLQRLLRENNEVFLADSFKAKMLELKALEKEASLAKKEVQSIKEALEASALEKSRASSSLSKLRESQEFKSIGELNGKKASLLREKQNAKTELLDLFAKVEKPLHRLDKAVSARKIFLPHGLGEFLNELITNPFVALRKDPKAEKLKQVLLETKKAIDSGLVELKEKEKQKKLDVLNELLSFDFFTEAFWKFNKIDSDLFSIEKSLKEMPAIKKESQLLSSLKSIMANKSRLLESLEAKEKQESLALKSIWEARLSMQDILSKALGKEVVFKG